MIIMRKEDRICGTPRTTFVMTGPGLLVMVSLNSGGNSHSSLKLPAGRR